MSRFKRFILESDELKTSQKKAMGLTYTGYGFYKDKSGKVYEWNDTDKKFHTDGDESSKASKLTNLKQRESALSKKVEKMRRDHDGDTGHFENELNGIRKQITALQ